MISPDPIYLHFGSDCSTIEQMKALIKADFAGYRLATRQEVESGGFPEGAVLFLDDLIDTPSGQAIGCLSRWGNGQSGPVKGYVLIGQFNSFYGVVLVGVGLVPIS